MSDTEGEWQGPEEQGAREDDAPQFLAEAHFFGGPLPHPEIMQGFEDALPGAADRIMTMAERQMNHRHEMEREHQQALITLQQEHNEGAHQLEDDQMQEGANIFKIALWGGIIIAVVIVVASTFLIYNDKSVQGFAVLIGSMAALVWGGIRAVTAIARHNREQQEQQDQQQEQEIQDVQQQQAPGTQAA